MQNFRIYWTDPQGQAQAQDCTNLSEALEITETKRKQGMRLVTMVSENSDSVGKPGVTSVVDGKLPDGSDYNWSKAGRAGKVRARDKIITSKDSH